MQETYKERHFNLSDSLSDIEVKLDDINGKTFDVKSSAKNQKIADNANKKVLKTRWGRNIQKARSNNDYGY